jgi:hypothetical protein
MQIDPDPLNNAGTSDTDITAIVAAAGNYAAEAQQSAEDAAASAEAAATAGATAGEAAAQAVVNNKLDKVGGDSAADIITFTSSDSDIETGLILPSGGEETVPALVTGATHAGLLGNISKIALNSRKLVNTVKRIWTSIANSWVSGASYAAGDVVTYIDGHTYLCILAHTSSSSITPGNTTSWQDKTLGDMISSLNSNYAKLNIKTHGSFSDTQQHNLPSTFKELFLKINITPFAAQSVIIPMHVISDELNATEHLYRLGYNFNGSTTAGVSLGITSSKIRLLQAYINNSDISTSASYGVFYR